MSFSFKTCGSGDFSNPEISRTLSVDALIFGEFKIGP